MTKAFLDTSVSSATILPLLSPLETSRLIAAHRVAPGCTVVTQGFQAANAGRAAGAARASTPLRIQTFLRQQFVRLGKDDGLRHLVFFLDQVLGKVAGVTAQLAAIQLDNDVRHLVQKSPVMGNGDDAVLKLTSSSSSQAIESRSR